MWTVVWKAMRRIVVSWAGIFLMPLAVSAASSAAPASPPKETRALWVTRWDYKTPDDVRAIIRNAAACYFNLVLFQVRGAATTFYPSSLEPWAYELTSKTPATLGRNPGFDPLRVALNEARQRGVELHAYINVLPGWKDKDVPPKSSKQVRAIHPDWFLFTRAGKPMPAQGFYAFLNPMRPEVKDHVTAIVRELLDNYDLDGLHLDYIRFPGEYQNGDVGYDPVSLKLFQQKCGATPDQAPEAWDQFRMDAVTDVVRRIYTTAKARKPSLMVSAAVTASRDKGLKENRQNALEWLNGGCVDCLMPMNYTADLTLFKTRAEDFLSQRKRGLIYMGIQADKGEKVLRDEIALTRSLGAHGLGVFAYSNLFPEHQPGALAQMVKSAIFKAPARIVG
ncbi:MAG: family 10 glycosylhydrolase, partial [Candidatus Sumerlaeota bacterium]|nr:family 10 glycosylhydrolase [Candidatus Sumerlaeota bacterium]